VDDCLPKDLTNSSSHRAKNLKYLAGGLSICPTKTKFMKFGEDIDFKLCIFARASKIHHLHQSVNFIK